MCWKRFAWEAGSWEGWAPWAMRWFFGAMEFLRALLWIQSSAGRHQAASASTSPARTEEPETEERHESPQGAFLHTAQPRSLTRFCGFFPAAGCVPQGFVN